MSSSVSAIASIGAGAAAGAAAGPVGAAVGAGVAAIKVGIAELTQHTARVKGATNENSAANAIVPAYDADLAAIQTAFSAGTYSSADCIAALQAVDNQCYAYLKSHVGPPGTAWNGTAGDCNGVGRSAACNKLCTVGCCIFYNNLDPGIKCCIAAIQAGGGVAKIPVVVASKYGLTGRAAYTISFAPPPALATIQGTVESAVDSLLGRTQAPLIPGTASTATGTSSTLLIGVAVVLLLALAFIFRGR